MRQRIFLRASGLATLFDCPARFYAQHIEKKWMPSGYAAHLGTSIHTATALYDQSVIDGAPVSTSDALDCFVDALKHPKEEVDWDGTTPAKLEKPGIAATRAYIHTIAPQFDFEAVELRFNTLTVAMDGIDLMLGGTTDRIYRSEAGYGIGDLKTGAKVLGTYGQPDGAKHRIQMGVYEILAADKLGVPMNAPAVIIGAQTDGSGKVGTATVPDAAAHLLGTEESPGVLHHAATLLKTGTFYGNPQSRLCAEKYCPAFRDCRWRK